MNAQKQRLSLVDNRTTSTIEQTEEIFLTGWLADAPQIERAFEVLADIKPLWKRHLAVARAADYFSVSRGVFRTMFESWLAEAGRKQ